MDYGSNRCAVFRCHDRWSARLGTSLTTSRIAIAVQSMTESGTAVTATAANHLVAQ